MGKKNRQQLATKTIPPTSGELTEQLRPYSRMLLLVVLVLFSLNLFIYAQVRHFEFIGWDDPLYVNQNAEVSQGLSWHGAKWAFTTGHAANWHPLTWLSLMLDVQLFGVSPGPIHLVNALFHAANSLLLFWILFQMTSSPGLSAVVAALFAVHPLHVESVAWVAERKDVFSTCLLFLTILAYIAYVRRPVLKRYLLVPVLFALALMSKPMVITLPALLLLLDLWPFRRATLKKGQEKVWRQLIREKLPLMVMAVVVSAVTVAVQRTGGTLGSPEAFPFGARIFNAFTSYAIYLVKMLWPLNLSAFYPLNPIPAWAAAVSALALAGISVLAIRIAENHPYILVGWGWYLVSLIPVIGLIQVGDQARADRYTYLPLIGIFFAITWGISNALRKLRSGEKTAMTAAFVVIFALALQARSQAGYWRDGITLWQHALDSTAHNAHANVNLGMALMDRGAISRAIAHYSEALRINPYFAEAHNALGVAFLRQNQLAQAGHEFAQALRIKPAFWEAQANMGVALARQGKPMEAIPYLRQALARKPEVAQIKTDLAEPHVQLGNILVANGEPDEALRHYREAIRIKPDSADAHTNAGICLMNKGLYQEAEQECREALRLNPAYPEAHNCLGGVLIRTARENEAVDQFKEAVRINPDYTEALINLSMVLINRMQDNEALVYLRKAVTIKPDHVGALSNLAIALINTGHEREAIPYLQRVLQIQPDNQRARETLKIALTRQKRG